MSKKKGHIFEEHSKLTISNLPWNFGFKTAKEFNDPIPVPKGRTRQYSTEIMHFEEIYCKFHKIDISDNTWEKRARHLSEAK
jgi:hypothetical protein